MEKVISVNLNGHAYHLEEAGYDLLRAYLESAAQRLHDNPDRAEIVADLEQAIAEKCGPYLGPHKSVVTAAEVKQILNEMGPVRDPEAATDAGEEGGEAKAAAGTTSERPGAPRRLYQIREGAIISGVCNGLAAYLNIDVTIVRIVFVALTVLTKGFWALVYVAMAIMIPYASTAEERAAAHGMPFNAQELIDRTKRSYRRQRRHWARQWRRSTRAPSAGAAEASQRPGYPLQIVIGVLTPILALLQAVALVLFVLAIISLVNSGRLFGWAVPEQIPLWAAVLMVVFIYQAIVLPLHAARYTAYGPGLQGGRPQEAWTGLVSLAATAFGLWLVYQYVPEVREFVRDVPRIAREVWQEFARP